MTRRNSCGISSDSYTSATPSATIDCAVDVDPAEVWERDNRESGDLSDLIWSAAAAVASVDGNISSREVAALVELRQRCQIEAHDSRAAGKG